MKRKYRAIGATVALTVGLSLAGPHSASARRVEPIAIVGITATIGQTQVSPLPSGKLTVGATVVGAGTIDCLENRGCNGAGLDGRPLPLSAVIYAVFDPSTGRTTGRILIDVIGAGFTGSVRGNATAVGPQEWDLELVIRARTRGGNRVAIRLDGGLERLVGLTGEMTGEGLVSQTDVDQI